MFSIAVIIFREVFEIALVVGVLLAATQGLVCRRRWITLGIFLGFLGSMILAYFANALSQGMGGSAREVFDASVLFFAAILIGWTVLWMQVRGRKMAQEMTNIGKEVACSQKPLYTLALVVGLATLREGSEAVLFTLGVFASDPNPWSVVLGCLIGLILGVLTGGALYLGLIKISPKKLFSITSVLLIFLAAGMVSQALGLLSSVGYLPEITPVFWDSSSWLPDSGLLGRFLHALTGYVSRPSGIQVLGYVVAIGLIWILGRIFNPIKKKGDT